MLKLGADTKDRFEDSEKGRSAITDGRGAGAESGFDGSKLTSQIRGNCYTRGALSSDDTGQSRLGIGDQSISNTDLEVTWDGDAGANRSISERCEDGSSQASWPKVSGSEVGQERTDVSNRRD